MGVSYDAVQFIQKIKANRRGQVTFDVMAVSNMPTPDRAALRSLDPAIGGEIELPVLRGAAVVIGDTVIVIRLGPMQFVLGALPRKGGTDG